MHSISSSYFRPQLNAENLGKLNVTHFKLTNARSLQANLFAIGAFAGSVGSIESITIRNVDGVNGGLIDLGSLFLHFACPTLKSLNLDRVEQLSSTSLTISPKLEYIGLTNLKSTS